MERAHPFVSFGFVQFASRYAPLYKRRSDIVAGSSEPTEAELAAGADEDDEDDEASTTDADAEDKGIPDFWLVALRNHVGISELSTSPNPFVAWSLLAMFGRLTT